MRVLFAASEALPYSKTGGLADVAQALPSALQALGVDVRLLTPAYRHALSRLHDAREIASLGVRGHPLRVLEGRAPGDLHTSWLLDCPELYARDGTPYVDADGRDHADNPLRFAVFCEAIARLAAGAVPGWRADCVHLNDWQTGLAPLYLPAAGRPRTVFTIHNLAYQGVYDRDTYDALGLPPQHWHMRALEFHGRFSFLKAGLVFADVLTTVSPSYAREIQTAEQGHGLDGVLRERAAALHGLLNGIDDAVWNPATDPALDMRYDRCSFALGKAANRSALRSALGLADDSSLLVGVISRLAYQKGTDLLLAARAQLRELPLQLVVLGSGERAQEQALRAWAAGEPERVAVHIGYDEALAHRINAGADCILMASRYEPCGLNQMYAQRYGTVPIVRRVGGLADTVVDATDAALADGSATGIQFEHADVGGLLYGLRRALELYAQPQVWRALQRAGMRRDFSWRHAAQAYVALYR
ncbi:MAG: glycogen synthase GlgA [Pseudomonadota bacterium]